MTKEALEKEAEESSKKAFCIAHTHEDELIYKNGYLAGSEPREKQLTKAKEIIQLLLNDFLYLCDMTNNSSCYESIEKANQFLKEE